MIEYNKVEEWISSDNTKKIQYVLLFFIFMLALSHQMFDHLFGDALKSFTKHVYVRHCVSLLFLYLLVDINTDNKETPVNPLISFIATLFIYCLAFILLHSNQLYIIFILSLVFFLILLDKYKKFIEQSVQDQESRKDSINLIYKTNNVFVILMILTIIIGSLSSFDKESFMKTWMQKV